MDWESEEARSQATAFGVGLTLVTKNGSAYIRFLSNEVWGHLEGKRRERGVGLPNGDEDFILPRVGERTRVDISGHITRFDRLEINESLFRIDPAHVHLASIRAEQGIIAPVPTRGRGSLRSAPIRLFCRSTRDDS